MQSILGHSSLSLSNFSLIYQSIYTEALRYLYARARVSSREERSERTYIILSCVFNFNKIILDPKSYIKAYIGHLHQTREKPTYGMNFNLATHIDPHVKISHRIHYLWADLGGFTGLGDYYHP